MIQGLLHVRSNVVGEYPRSHDPAELGVSCGIGLLHRGVCLAGTTSWASKNGTVVWSASIPRSLSRNLMKWLGSESGTDLVRHYCSLFLILFFTSKNFFTTSLLRFYFFTIPPMWWTSRGGPGLVGHQPGWLWYLQSHYQSPRMFSC